MLEQVDDNTAIVRGYGYDFYDISQPQAEGFQLRLHDPRLVIERLAVDNDHRHRLLAIEYEYGLLIAPIVWPCPGGNQCRMNSHDVIQCISHRDILAKPMLAQRLMHDIPDDQRQSITATLQRLTDPIMRDVAAIHARFFP